MTDSTLFPDSDDEPHTLQEPASLVENITELHSMGVGEMIDLPQLLACGNEDSGKHAVIEAITRARFPAKTGTAHFVTEIKLRRQPKSLFRVAIRSKTPARNDIDTPTRPFLLTHVTSTGNSFSVISKASQLIATTCRHGVSDEILDIEIGGPDQPNLLIVDLPGLQPTDIDHDTQEEEDGVTQMLRGYMKNPRSFILAVLSADVNLQSQRILDIAAEFDPKQQRTLGVITHSNKLGPMSDLDSLSSEIVTRKLSLGWLLLPENFHRMQKTPYEKVDKDRPGSLQMEYWEAQGKCANYVESLQDWLGDIFAKHTQDSVAGLISDIQTMILDKESKLPKLILPRHTLEQQRSFLFSLSNRFERILSQALSGIYTDAFFDTRGDADHAAFGDSRRLCFIIHELNSHFEEAIEVIGSRRKLPEASGGWKTFRKLANHYDNIRSPECLERVKLENEIARQIQPDGGLHVLGSSNHSLVGALFRDQTQPWDEIAQVHLMKSWKSARSCVISVLQYLTDQRTSDLIMQTLIDPELEKYKTNLLAKLEELTAYNKRGQISSSSRSVLATIENCRNERLLARIQETLPTWDKGAVTKEQLKLTTQALKTSSREFAAAEIVDQMQAHYDVSIQPHRWTHIHFYFLLTVSSMPFGHLLTILLTSQLRIVFSILSLVC